MFDRAIHCLGDSLRPFSLRGYHFTRLTDHEAAQVEKQGLEILSVDLIERRIAAQVTSGALTLDQGSRLLQKNQIRDANRTGMAWFCFYAANEVLEGGVMPLLKHWGGEALYNFNADDLELGPLLRSMGRPALIEAHVPASYLSNTFRLASAVYRADLANQGLRTKERPGRFEDYSTRPLDSRMVRQVLRYPEPEFIRLTGCKKWNQPLK